jgi:aminocarboxymuconate-semialdehyde decarboxylase
MLIDIHHHYIPMQYIEAARADPERWNAATYTEKGTGRLALATGFTEPPPWPDAGRSPWGMDPGMYDLSARLAEMAEIGLDMAALSVPPGLFQHELPGETAQAAAEIQNAAIQEAVQAYPKSFVGMGTVPLVDVDRAIEELERIVREYGFPSIEIGGSVNGRHYDEPEFDAFFRRAAELGVLVFIHPHVSPPSERLLRYHTRNIIGFPVESGICAAAFIFGGTMKRYPNIKICLAHGGGIVPGLIGRWDHGWSVREEAQEFIDQPPSTYYKQFFFDNLSHGDRVLSTLLESVGADHVMVGTDYPYDMATRDPVGVLDRQQLSAEDRTKIESGNAVRLLGLDIG